MEIYTMGFTQKKASRFFELIRKFDIQILIDIRLNNQSQLAGFTKGTDLKFFLKEICDCDYAHELSYAPTKEILDGYKKGNISWSDYEEQFGRLIGQRKIEKSFENQFGSYDRVLLLCSEPTAKNCHRRLVAEYLSKELECKVIHI